MDMELSGTQPQLQHAGRGDRVARTREAIVSSTLTLAMEGEVAPIVRDIAKLAGVSARTVFQHFADTAELYVAVLGRVLTNLRGVEAQPASASSALDERISEVIGQRAGRYEKLLPMWTFVETLQRRSTTAAEMIAAVYAKNHASLQKCFDRELTGLAADQRDRMLNALAVALAPESWVVLRQRLDLPVEQAREELRFVVTAVIAGGAIRR
jgi:AcrR family transcriptional regulator